MTHQQLSWWHSLPQFTLCAETGRLAEGGNCPVHGGDACLFQFVRVREAVEAFRVEIARTAARS